MDLNTGQVSQVAAHDAPIRCARFLEGVGGAGTVVVTGSWDKTIRVGIEAIRSITSLSLH
jgi:mRNA export factor